MKNVICVLALGACLVSPALATDTDDEHGLKEPASKPTHPVQPEGNYAKIGNPADLKKSETPKATASKPKGGLKDRFLGLFHKKKKTPPALTAVKQNK